MPNSINYSLRLQCLKVHEGRWIRLSFLLLSFVALSINVYAQGISYSYDSAGNRISKTYVYSMSRSYDAEGVQLHSRNNDLAANILVSVNNNLVSVIIVDYDKAIECDISINSTDGKLLRTVHANSPISHINIEDMAEGVYLLNVTHEAENRVWKIVKK